MDSLSHAVPLVLMGSQLDILCTLGAPCDSVEWRQLETMKSSGFPWFPTRYRGIPVGCFCKGGQSKAT